MSVVMMAPVIAFLLAQEKKGVLGPYSQPGSFKDLLEEGVHFLGQCLLSYFVYQLVFFQGLEKIVYVQDGVYVLAFFTLLAFLLCWAQDKGLYFWLGVMTLCLSMPQEGFLRS